MEKIAGVKDKDKYMCAINPLHKHRFHLDVYTSHPMSLTVFEDMIFEKVTELEQQLNQDARLRWHVKETEEEAD